MLSREWTPLQTGKSVSRAVGLRELCDQRKIGWISGVDVYGKLRKVDHDKCG